MKLPWVSRALYLKALEWEDHYDRSVTNTANALFANRDLSAAVERANVRYESLVNRMLEMKREGFKTMPLLTEPLKPSESALPPEIEFEIERMATGDPSLRRHYSKWAQGQVALKKPVGDIAHRIRYGDDSEEMENES